MRHYEFITERKKKRRKQKLSRYFFPGFAYYGGTSDSGEGGGDGGGGESIREGKIAGTIGWGLVGMLGGAYFGADPAQLNYIVPLSAALGGFLHKSKAEQIAAAKAAHEKFRQGNQAKIEQLKASGKIYSVYVNGKLVAGRDKPIPGPDYLDWKFDGEVEDSDDDVFVDPAKGYLSKEEVVDAIHKAAKQEHDINSQFSVKDMLENEIVWRFKITKLPKSAKSLKEADTSPKALFNPKPKQKSQDEYEYTEFVPRGKENKEAWAIKRTVDKQKLPQKKPKELNTGFYKNYLGNRPIREADEEVANEVEKFKDWACKKLHIKNPPKIELSYDTEEAQEGHHTGRHVEGSGNIWVYAANRNLVDILRTVFHELVHVRQGELGLIDQGDSYPGSPIEAMADMLAGKYIKIYGKQNRKIFQ